MAKIGEGSWKDALKFRDAVREDLRGCDSLEAAAQCVVEAVCSNFCESVVLTRFFATVPYRGLPSDTQAFVNQLALDKGHAADLDDDTPVLALLGTCGGKEAWNSRHQSQGHLGIPLLSARFVESIPMIARLLKELEVDLDWLDGEVSTGFTEKELGGGWIGLFYVRDAKTALDPQGRPIISAQDFVAEHQIGTVFGLGGIYNDGTLFTVVVFTRDIIEKERITDHTPLVPLIRAATAHLVQDGKIFA